MEKNNTDKEKIEDKELSLRERVNNSIREKSEGKERKIIYLMIASMFLMLLVSIYQRFQTKDSYKELNIDEQIYNMKNNIISKPIKAVNNINELTKYVEEYEKTLNSKNIDTLKLKELENKIKQYENRQK